jgi:hypothetical protein
MVWHGGGSFSPRFRSCAVRTDSCGARDGPSEAQGHSVRQGPEDLAAGEGRQIPKESLRRSALRAPSIRQNRSCSQTRGWRLTECGA